VNEYVLPVTVRKVLSIRHQESPLRLEEMNRSQVYDRIVQRPHETISDQPLIAIIGGKSRTLYSTDSTYLEGQVNNQTWTSMLVYPTPDTSIVLHYSYMVARPDLTNVSDFLGADRSIETLLVKLAFARCMQDAVGDFNPEAGMALEQRVLREVSALHTSDQRDPGRHRVLGSNFCESSGGIDFGRLPRNYGTGT